MNDNQAIVSNEYGAVYADRVSFYSKKGWLGGGVLEELPIRHVTSVRFETTRNWLLGIVLLVIGLAAMSAEDGVGIVPGLFFLIIAALLLWGSPKVTLNTAGGDLRPASGAPWTTGAAKAFSDGVRTALFAK